MLTSRAGALPLNSGAITSQSTGPGSRCSLRPLTANVKLGGPPRATPCGTIQAERTMIIRTVEAVVGAPRGDETALMSASALAHSAKAL